jgi:hypothetical protein
MKDMEKVYISSTYDDLQKEREAAAQAVRRLGHQPIAMEDYVATDQRPVDKCLQDVRNCDAYVGIFAWRYGYIPDGYDKSITHLEYEAARKAKIPCLIFLLDENAPWPVKYVARGEERQKIDQLRGELKKKHVVSIFKNADELCGLVSAAVSRIKFPPQVPSTPPRGASDLRLPLFYETSPVTRPGMFRYIMDRCLPRVHTWLTTRIGLFKQPQEWTALNNYLRTLRSNIADDIREKTYIVPPTKDLPDEVDRIKAKRRGFLTPIQQLIKEIMGISKGGDAQNARISAIGKKSKFVRNIVKRLLKADEPLILLGDPGTGKSITLQQAAMLIADKESKRVFPTICLFIRLGEFQVHGDIHMQSVWDHVKRTTPREIQPFIDSLKDSGRLVIFFDGMDEMSRERYNEHTRALSIFAGSNKHFTKTLFSCRVTDFTPRFQHNRLVLMPFSRSHIFQYIKRQIPHFPVKIGNRNWSARQLAKRLARGDLPMQADNPFVLWLLCTYLQEEQDWPKSRVHLLEYYNRFNYQRKARDAEQSNVSMPDMDRTFLTLGRIAYEITDRNKGTAIPLEDVKKLLASEEFGAVQAGLQCGFLQKSLDLEITLIRFEHHRFQEYFAAFYLSNNEQERSTFKWLDKLDAPRWQETLFNLVLMGGGHEALNALDQAIKQGLSQLNEFQRAGKTLGVAPLETLVADRVELASRILQQARQQPDEMFDQLLATFRHAAYWLSDHGNPITKVKMMWAANIVQGIDIFRVARESLASPVSWVRQQALVITSVASGDVGGGTLQEDLLHGFASGRFLNRFSGYVRIARDLKQKKLWCVLIIGLTLYMFQLLAAFGMVAATRHIMVPLISVQDAAYNKFEELNVYLQEKRILRDKDDNAFTKLKEVRKNSKIRVDRFEKIGSVVQESFDSRWFLVVVVGAMLVTILFTFRRVPGEHFFIGQSVGFICYILPFIWWSIWFGYWSNLLAWVWAFLPISFWILNMVNILLTLLIQGSTLSLFIASSYYWKGPVRNKRMLLETMWENCGFRIGKEIAFSVGVYSFSLIGLFMIFELTRGLTTVDWKVFWKNFATTFGLFSFLPQTVNISISIILYLEIIVGLVSLSLGLKGKHNRWRQSKKVFLKWSIYCLILPIIILLNWGVDLVNWQAFWAFIVVTFDWLPFFPILVNIALSLVICAEIIGCLVSLVSGLMQKYNRWQRSMKMFLIWTGFCFGLSMVVLLIWGLVSMNWKAFWKFITTTFGLLPFFPPIVNVALSFAIYIEIIGIVISLVSGLKQRYNQWRRGLKILQKWTVFCLGLVLITFLGWGLYIFSNYISRALAIILFIALVVIFVIILKKLIRDVIPLLDPVFQFIGIRRLKGYPGYNSESWKKELSSLDPNFQASLLRRTTPETLDLTINNYLSLLQEVEHIIEKEPALSVYWAKRNQVEQIIRQEKSG